MRRYLGSDWLSAGETASQLGISLDAVVVLAERGGLSVRWVRVRRAAFSVAVERSPYFARGQVEQLAVRFGALDAAFEEWPSEGFRRLGEDTGEAISGEVDG